MSNEVPTTSGRPFVERRRREGAPPGGVERRQFANHYEDLSPAAQELALAIDRYKLENRRRFINYEEILGVVLSLGYRKS